METSRTSSASRHVATITTMAPYQFLQPRGKANTTGEVLNKAETLAGARFFTLESDVCSVKTKVKTLS